MTPFQALRATIDELINGLLHLQPFPQGHPINLQLEGVYITPFLEEYLLPMIYKGYIYPLEHIRRLKPQCAITAKVIPFF